jgi:uncharacterized membrane protein
MHFALCKEQQHITVKNRNFCDFGVAEAPTGFQAGWSDCMFFSLSLFLFGCSSGISV